MLKSALVPFGIVVKTKNIIHVYYIALYNNVIGVDTMIIIEVDIECWSLLVFGKEMYGLFE